MGVEGPPSAAGRAPGLLRRWAFEGRESKGSREVGIQAQRPEENVAEGLGGGSNMADSCGREWGSRRRRLCGCLRTGSLRREWLKKQQPFSLLSLKGRRVETNRPGSRGWVVGVVRSAERRSLVALRCRRGASWTPGGNVILSGRHSFLRMDWGDWAQETGAPFWDGSEMRTAGNMGKLSSRLRVRAWEG